MVKGSYTFPFLPGCPRTLVKLGAGVYFFEVWGASGGGNYGGKGGYSSGVAVVTNKTSFYITVGGEGISSIPGSGSAGGCNGGGKGGIGKVHKGTLWLGGSGGGGATDIRISDTSLNSRIIVAGGGGGQCSSDAKYSGVYNGKPGFGGGIKGGNGGGMQYTSTGADQTKGNGNGIGQNGRDGTDGTHEGSEGNGGGGGGYFGGLSNQIVGVNSDTSGGGGSGYVSGHYQSNINHSFVLLLPNTIGGDSNFKLPNGAFSFGNKGNGFARITLLSGIHHSCNVSTYRFGGYFSLFLLFFISKI